MTSTVGQSVSVIDASERVTGRTEYVLDLELPRMAHGRFVRSYHPHARIVSLDTTSAEALPGVFTVLTGAAVRDLIGSPAKYGRFFLDQSVLAVDTVRFIGEPIAAVAATNPEVAAEACELIEVEYEPLPAVFTVAEALSPGAQPVHDPRPELRDEFKTMIGSHDEPGNLCSYFSLRRGSVEQGLADSDHLFTDSYQSPAVQHVPLEPHVSVASFSANLTVWSSTQMPYAVRAQLSELLGMAQSEVRVLTSNLGGGFGAKGSLRLEPIASLLSRACGRPVKIVLDRDEEFVTVTKHAASVEVTSGVSSEGLLIARQVKAYFNTGAYADVGPMVARNAGSAMIGPYRIPHVAVDSHAVWTNLVPAGAFRGFGVSQGAWAYESHTDNIAASIGLDPVEFRRRNLLRSGDVYATGERVQELHFDRLLDRVTESIDWGATRGSDESQAAPSRTRRGKAVATVMKATITPSTSTAALKLNGDGTVNLLTSSVDMGQGVKTVLAQIAAEALAVPYGTVKVSEPDTDLTPYEQQTSSSRSTYSMGSAVVDAAEDVKRQLLELGAERLEASPEDLELADGGVQVRGVPSRRLAYSDLLGAALSGNLLGRGSSVTEGGLDPRTGQGVASVHWHHGAAGCEVEVDIETGKIDVQRVASAVYAGRVINPQLCELQVEGSVLFGLGQALFEEIAFESGQVSNPNLADYMIPSFVDVPESTPVFLLEDEGHPDVHGVGETCLPPISPAIANAVYDAIGVRITELPITPEKVLRALAEQGVRMAEPTSTGERERVSS